MHWKEEAVRDKRLLIETAYDGRPDFTRRSECIIVPAPLLDARIPCLSEERGFLQDGSGKTGINMCGRQATGCMPYSFSCLWQTPMIHSPGHLVQSTRSNDSMDRELDT
jgi:hypothetical protein